MSERATVLSRSEKSAEAVAVSGLPLAKGRTRESEVHLWMSEAMRQMPGSPGRSEKETGEARQSPGLDEADPPPRPLNDTGPGCLRRSWRARTFSGR